MMNFGLVSNVDLSKVHQCYGQPVEVPKELSNVVAKKRNPVEATLRKNKIMIHLEHPETQCNPDQA
jgi:hypothetical protein